MFLFHYFPMNSFLLLKIVREAEKKQIHDFIQVLLLFYEKTRSQNSCFFSSNNANRNSFRSFHDYVSCNILCFCRLLRRQFCPTYYVHYAVHADISKRSEFGYLSSSLLKRYTIRSNRFQEVRLWY